MENSHTAWKATYSVVNLKIEHVMNVKQKAQSLPIGTEYVDCRIRWKDDKSENNVTICLECSDDNPNDESIFFYCDGIGGLVELCEGDNGEDFDIIDIM